ncbi:MAG: helix-turn-helix transcriptional regulator [Bacteroidetes bacterium]|nr:helix-turn-helix transcriptional regulator [Bacteroidota bacterium]
MKERLLQLLDLEHLTPSKFADLIGVQRSSVSHILSGRNKPSFDFLQKTLTTFPSLKADWLMLGEGSIYDQMGRDQADLFEQEDLSPAAPESNDITGRGELLLNDAEKLEEKAVHDLSDISEASITNAVPPDQTVEAKKIVQVMLFYDDDTFITYKPSQ